MLSSTWRALRTGWVQIGWGVEGTQWGASRSSRSPADALALRTSMAKGSLKPRLLSSQCSLMTQGGMAETSTDGRRAQHFMVVGARPVFATHLWRARPANRRLKIFRSLSDLAYSEESGFKTADVQLKVPDKSGLCEQRKGHDIHICRKDLLNSAPAVGMTTRV
jgi:hypothetical protein